jgi:predicted amidohydrolase YtcJ
VLAAGVKVVGSSDEDLLALDPWRGVRILRPRYFSSAEAREGVSKKIE